MKVGQLITRTRNVPNEEKLEMQVEFFLPSLLF